MDSGSHCAGSVPSRILSSVRIRKLARSEVASRPVALCSFMLPPYLAWTPAVAPADWCAARAAKADRGKKTSEGHLQHKRERAEIKGVRQTPQCTNSSGVPDFARTTRMICPAAWVPAGVDIRRADGACRRSPSGGRGSGGCRSGWCRCRRGRASVGRSGDPPPAPADGWRRSDAGCEATRAS